MNKRYFGVFISKQFVYILFFFAEEQQTGMYFEVDICCYFGSCCWCCSIVYFSAPVLSLYPSLSVFLHYCISPLFSRSHLILLCRSIFFILFHSVFVCLFGAILFVICNPFDYQIIKVTNHRTSTFPICDVQHVYRVYRTFMFIYIPQLMALLPIAEEQNSLIADRFKQNNWICLPIWCGVMLFNKRKLCVQMHI